MTRILKSPHTFPVSAGLLDPRHVKAIGRAVWIYLWFLNRVTRDEQRDPDGFVGVVLNGRPVSIDEISKELGVEYHGCRRLIAHLVKTGYVERKKTGAGMFTYAVTKSKKWVWKRQASAAWNQSSSSTEKQADLFTPTEAPTEQKMLSGSRNPQSEICSQGANPQSGKCNSTEQNLLCAIDGSRARLQETTKVLHGERSSPPCSSHSKLNPAMAEAIPPGLSKLEYTRMLLAHPQIALPWEGNNRIVAGSIEVWATSQSIELWEAFEQIRNRALSDIAHGEKVNYFWFQDGRYDSKKSKNAATPTIDYFTDNPATRALAQMGEAS